MEKTNLTSANEILSEHAKLANNLSHDATALMMDLYIKQMGLVSGFYSNFFSSVLGANKNMMDPAKNFSDLLLNNGAMKSMCTPFNNFGMNGGFHNPASNLFTNPFLNQSSNPFEKIVKQVTDYNHNLVSSFSKQFSKENSNESAVNQKNQNGVEKEFESQKL